MSSSRWVRLRLTFSYISACPVLAGDRHLVAAFAVRGEVTVEDLKFSVHETAALLGRNPDIALDSEDVHRIFERTEGWPIALQLSRSG